MAMVGWGRDGSGGWHACGIKLGVDRMSGDVEALPESEVIY